MTSLNTCSKQAKSYIQVCVERILSGKSKQKKADRKSAFFHVIAIKQISISIYRKYPS